MQTKSFQKQMMKQIRNSLETFVQWDSVYVGLFNVEMSEGQ